MSKIILVVWSTNGGAQYKGFLSQRSATEFANELRDLGYTVDALTPVEVIK